MNKKATTHQWWEILIIVLAIIVLIILIFNYFGSKGLFGGVKDAAETIWSYAPNVSIGLKSLNATSVTLPGKQEEEVNSLKSTIDLMLTSKEHNCFGKFDPLEKLGDKETFKAAKATHITATFDEKSGETLFIIGTAGGQIYQTFREPMKPCVIAGPYNVAENFYDYFNQGQGLKDPYYTLVAGVDISYREGMIYDSSKGGSFNDKLEFSWYNGNVIRVLGFPENMVNNQNDNFQNGGMLFKGKGNDICFFPTNKLVNNEDGVDHDYIGNPNKKESLLFRWNNGENAEGFKRCY